MSLIPWGFFLFLCSFLLIESQHVSSYAIIWDHECRFSETAPISPLLTTTGVSEDLTSPLRFYYQPLFRKGTLPFFSGRSVDRTQESIGKWAQSGSTAVRVTYTREYCWGFFTLFSHILHKHFKLTLNRKIRERLSPAFQRDFEKKKIT